MLNLETHVQSVSDVIIYNFIPHKVVLDVSG